MPSPALHVHTWGELDGAPVRRFQLTNAAGTTLSVCELGATLTGLELAGRDGRQDDVVLGYDDLAGYASDRAYLGCVVGRCANRIAGARFTLDGREHVLAANDGDHHLHGGPGGFHRQLWHGEAGVVPAGQVVRFTRTSPDGEEGYPGRVEVSVSYTLAEDDRLTVALEATSDGPTLVNLAQHAYWNLAGHGAGSVAGHQLRLRAGAVLPVDEGLIPTGERRPVEGTAFDFREARSLGDADGRIGPDGAGFDHDLVVDREPGAVGPVAELIEPLSGRRLRLASDQPGCQLYTANAFDGSLVGKGGVRYGRHAGLCLETQAHPDAIHREADRASVILRPGERYQHEMALAFDRV